MLKKSTKAGILCFFLMFTYHIIFNVQIPCMRSLPDEMGAVTLGAKLAGYNWNYVMTHPEIYYGSANVIFAFPIFVFVKDPMVQYQLLFAAAAFMKAAAGFIVVKISMDYYDVNSLRAVLFGIICTLITPARSSNIDNEPMLILMCWIVLYLILVINRADTKKKKAIFTILLSFFLAYAQWAHTRAVLYILLLIGMLVVHYFIEKKTVLHIPAFIISFLIFFVIVRKGIAWCTLNLFTAPEGHNTAMVSTLANLIDSVSDNLKSLARPAAIRSCLDIVCGNIWCMGIFGCGTLIYISVYVIKKLYGNVKCLICRRQTKSEDILYYLTLFGVIGVLVTLAGLSITWKESVVDLHEGTGTTSRALFYLRYYGNYFGIITLYFLILWDKGELFDKKVLKAAIGITAGCYAYSVVSFVSPLLSAGNTNLDWFGYFAPLSLTGASWDDKRQTLFYFTNATFVSMAILVLLSGKKGKIYLTSVLAAILLYQYGFNVLQWDVKYAKSERYYQAANGIYELKKEHPRIFDSVDKIYYYSDSFGSQYIVQFMLGKPEVFLQEAYQEDDEAMILAYEDIDGIDLNEYRYMVIDENEILYIKGDKLQKTVEEEGFILQDCIIK